MEKRILVIYTGGTIGMIKNEVGALVPVSNKLVEKVRNIPQMHDKNCIARLSDDDDEPPLVLPTQKGKAPVYYWIMEWDPLLDSSNISAAEWIRIANQIKDHYQAYDGFVVLHGTDTLAYTASALSFLFSNLGKTVIVTGSQVPIFETSSDGLNNFLSSLIIAGSHVIPEVCVFFGNKLMRGNRTVKASSINSKGAFDSPNCAPLATFSDSVKVNIAVIFSGSPDGEFSQHGELSRNVAILRMYPNITAQTVKAFLQPPVEGCVVQTFGAGNIPDRRADIVAALASATSRGVVIVNCTQCFSGPVRPIYATNKALVDAGVVVGYDMTVEAAFTKLSYVLSVDDWDLKTKREMMETNLRGELSRDICETRDINSNDVLKSIRMPSADHQRSNEAFLPDAMCRAAADGDVQLLMSLEQRGGDFNMKNVDGRSALHIACFEGHVEAVELALRHGAHADLRDKFDRTPLLDAVLQEQSEVIRLLIDAGARLPEDASVSDALARAAALGQLSLLRAFALAGASFNQRDCLGRSPLHMAVLGEQMEVIKYLMEIGVDANSFDSLSKTPLDYASIKNIPSVINLLSGS